MKKKISEQNEKENLNDDDFEAEEELRESGEIKWDNIKLYIFSVTVPIFLIASFS